MNTIDAVPDHRAVAHPATATHCTLTAGREQAAPFAVDSRWRSISTIPTPACGVVLDHLLIGPSGVYAVCIDPFNLSDVRFAARRAATLLSGKAHFDVEVHPVAVTTWAMYGEDAGTRASVTVLDAEGLAAHLAAAPPLLGAPSIERIFAVAQCPQTWQPKALVTAP